MTKEQELIRELTWAVSWLLRLIPEKADSVILPRWFCPHCGGMGTGYQPDPIRHNENCDYVRAVKILQKTKEQIP
jgi:hypothetical protein